MSACANNEQLDTDKATAAASKTNSSSSIITTTTSSGGKTTSPDAVVTGLRCELRHLYESLAEKNELLLQRERDIRDRDASVRFLRTEFERMRVRQQDNTNVNQKPPTPTDCDRNAATTAAAPPADLDAGQLRDRLAERDATVKELSAKCLRLSHDLAYVQRSSLAKDERMREMQTEMDKFRQILRPLTQAMLASNGRDSQTSRHVSTDSMDEWRTPLLGGGGEAARVKRLAISAEPITMKAMKERGVAAQAVPKSSL